MALRAKNRLAPGSSRTGLCSWGGSQGASPQGLVIPSRRTTTKYGRFFSATQGPRHVVFACWGGSRREGGGPPHFIFARRARNQLRFASCTSNSRQNWQPSQPSDVVFNRPYSSLTISATRPAIRSPATRRVRPGSGPPGRRCCAGAGPAGWRENPRSAGSGARHGALRRDWAGWAGRACSEL